MQQSCLYYFDIRLWSSFLYFLQWSPNTMCPPVWDSFLKLCCFFVKDISALKQENEHLRQEVDKLKAELEYWEVRNGCKFRVSYACFAFFLLKLFYHWIEIGHAGFFFFQWNKLFSQVRRKARLSLNKKKLKHLSLNKQKWDLKKQKKRSQWKRNRRKRKQRKKERRNQKL